MPVHNGELAFRLEDTTHCRRQAKTIGHAVECVRHEHIVHRLDDHLGELTGIARDKLNVASAATPPRKLEASLVCDPCRHHTRFPPRARIEMLCRHDGERGAPRHQDRD